MTSCAVVSGLAMMHCQGALSVNFLTVTAVAVAAHAVVLFGLAGFY